LEFDKFGIEARSPLDIATVVKASERQAGLQ